MHEHVGMSWKQPGWEHCSSKCRDTAVLPSNSLSPREEYVLNWCGTSITGIELPVCRVSLSRISFHNNHWAAPLCHSYLCCEFVSAFHHCSSSEVYASSERHIADTQDASLHCRGEHLEQSAQCVQSPSLCCGTQGFGRIHRAKQRLELQSSEEICWAIWSSTPLHRRVPVCTRLFQGFHNFLRHFWWFLQAGQTLSINNRGHC